MYIVVLTVDVIDYLCTYQSFFYVPNGFASKYVPAYLRGGIIAFFSQLASPTMATIL
jgi:hypothetical protein